MPTPPESHCFAEPGADHIIDVINPDTGRSQINGHDLATIRERYPRAEIVPLAEFVVAKAARQDSPLAWEQTTEEKFFEMLEVLPPAAMRGGDFLVGEPWDHHAITGRARFACYRRRRDGTFWTSSRPITRDEFHALN